MDANMETRTKKSAVNPAAANLDGHALAARYSS
jgi:hypothetical protein